MSQDPLHLLCIEPRFPGRLGAVADWLVRHRGYRCQFYSARFDSRDCWPESVGRGLELVQFGVGGVAKDSSVSWRRNLERGLCYAYGCWEVLHARRPQPIDLVLGRSAGAGSTLYAPVYRPGVPIVNLFDYFYDAHAHDLAEEFKADLPTEYYLWRRSANAMDLLDLENGVTPWTLTEWQRGLYPVEYREDFHVIYDGVDTRRFRPSRSPTRSVAGRIIPPGTRVVTFAARALDRLRGFDRFLELANRLLRARSEVVCIAAGAPVVQRALDVQSFSKDYRAAVLAANPPHDPERLWFLDMVTPSVLAELFAASDLHVYPSRPYVVARSLVEAMSAGCVVLAWDSEPVREFIADAETGLFVSASDWEAIERRALAVLDDQAAYRPLGLAATELVRQKYAQDVVLPRLAQLFDRLVQ